MKTTKKVDVAAAIEAIRNLPPRYVVQGWLNKYPDIAKDIRAANLDYRTHSAMVKAVIEIVRRHTKKLYKNPSNYVNLTATALGHDAFHARFKGAMMNTYVVKELEKLNAKA